MIAHRTSRIATGLLLLTTNCTSVGQEQPIVLNVNDAVDARRLGRRFDQIPMSELRAVQGATVADAVRQLRPEFLRTSPQRTIGGQPMMPSVYLDGRPAGTLDVLHTIPLAPVTDIQYLPPITAKSMFGSYCACDGGVILVRTASRDP